MLHQSFPQDALARAIAVETNQFRVLVVVERLDDLLQANSASSSPAGGKGSAICGGQPSSSNAVNTRSWLSAGCRNRLTNSVPRLRALGDRSPQQGFGQPQCGACGA